MNAFLKSAVLLSLAVLAWPTAAPAAITVDGVIVGDANNPANPATTYGSVGYDYAIGKYEVTISQYTSFLNSVARTDTYGLWNSQMSGPPETRGISRSGSSGFYTYSVIGDGNRPIAAVSWLSAARFVNWMHNGQPVGAQGPATTEAGAYLLNGATSGTSFTRTDSARFWIPTYDEWYKAAYYQPADKGGPASGWWLYPTRSDIQPNSRNGSTTDPNSANYYYNDGIANGYNGGYAVNNSTTEPLNISAITRVGAFTLASSYYGTFDQGGNVAEWGDSVYGKALCGGSFTDPAIVLSSIMSINVSDTSIAYLNVGFRIGMLVPEPSTPALLAFGAACCWWRRRPKA